MPEMGPDTDPGSLIWYDMVLPSSRGTERSVLVLISARWPSNLSLLNRELAEVSGLPPKEPLKVGFAHPGTRPAAGSFYKNGLYLGAADLPTQQALTPTSRPMPQHQGQMNLARAGHSVV